MKNTKYASTFWIAVLILSTVAIWVLISLPIKIYFGINMPFVTVNNEQMIFFGYNIPAEKQFGFMMLTAILLMLPARTLHLAIVKLGEMQRKKKQEELWQRKMISEQRKRDTTIGY